MSRRIDVELTSLRPDGSWTWRAAGAKQPKGDIAGHLVPAGAKVGEVLRAEADFAVEGIEIIRASYPKGDNRVEPERLVITGTRQREELVNVTYAERGRGKGKGPRRHDGDDDRPRGRAPGRDRGPGRDARGDRPARPGADRAAAPGGRGPDRRDGKPRRERSDGPDQARRGGARPERPNRRPEPQEAPRLKKLKAGRRHRKELLRALPEIQRPLAELLQRGGIAEVRQALERQNALAKADGLPLVSGKLIESVADKLLPLIRSADWYDRAEAAMAQLDQLDLRDLRSVVVASDSAARDDEARALAADLRTALSRRVEEEHAAWLRELSDLLQEGRVVRALRLSSRPPKAGSPLPPDVAQRLAGAAAEALGVDTFPDRYAMLIEAVAFSPVRLQVVPAAIPAKTSNELTTAVRKLAGRVPQIAKLFGVEPPAPGGRGERAAVPPPPAVPPAPPAVPADATPADATPVAPTR